mgnify:FL=1
MLFRSVTFKENCPDFRNSKVIDIINRLNEYEISVTVVDPVVDKDELKGFYDIEMASLSEMKDADCIIFAVAHKEFLQLSFEDIDNMYRKSPFEEKVLIDVKNIFNRKEMENMGFSYWSL